jgi:DNA-binding transcriptional LysR family regulator
MDLTQLRSLLEFADTGSITRAAERLNYAPSSVSAHLRAIESEVGIELTERIGRGIGLTNAGRAFVPHAKRIVDAVSAAVMNARETRRSALTIAGAQSYVGYVLPYAARELSELGMTLTIRTLLSCSDNVRGVVDGEHDVGVTLDARDALTRGRSDPRIAFEVLGDAPIAIVAAPAHPVVRSAAGSLDALHGTTIIDTEPGCYYREAFAHLLDAAEIDIADRISSDDFAAIRALARAGAGVAVVPWWVVADELRAGTLVELPLPRPVDFVCTATWRRDRESEALERVLAVLRATTLATTQRPPAVEVLERP